MNTIQEIMQFSLFNISDTPVNVATALTAIIIGLITWWASRTAEKATVHLLTRKGVQDEGSIRASARLAYYIVLCIGLAIAIHTLGINLTALFTAGAIFAIGLGFAMQNIIQNFVSGLILLIEQTLKPGDIIEAEGRMVKITNLGMRATVARTWDSDDLIIPNSILVSSTVKNFTLRDKLHRIRTTVGVSYDSDMALVRSVLEELSRNLTWIEKDTNPVVLMKLFGSSSVDFEVSVWVKDPFGRSAMQSLLNEAIWFGLKDAEIVIAYPQMDVHFDKVEQ